MDGFDCVSSTEGTAGNCVAHYLIDFFAFIIFDAALAPGFARKALYQSLLPFVICCVIVAFAALRIYFACGKSPKQAR